MKKEKKVPDPIGEARENALSVIRAIEALKTSTGRAQMMHGAVEGVYNAPLDAMEGLRKLLLRDKEVKALYKAYDAPEPKSEGEKAARKVGNKMTSPVNR